jgi:predicted RNA-binding Zn ribbon-like protein
VEPVDAIPFPGERPPAPGRLRLVQRFVNTVDHEHGREMLHSPERLRALLAELGLLPANAAVGEPDLRAAHELRAALRSLALANNGARSRVPVDPGAIAVLERAAADGGLLVRFDDRARATLEPAASGVRGAFAALVGIVYTAVADGTWPRLKACRRDVCGWLFYDRSRNRSARWCQMAVCGNRTKTRAYRARRAG